MSAPVHAHAHTFSEGPAALLHFFCTSPPPPCLLLGGRPPVQATATSCCCCVSQVPNKKLITVCHSPAASPAPPFHSRASCGVIITTLCSLLSKERFPPEETEQVRATENCYFSSSESHFWTVSLLPPWSGNKLESPSGCLQPLCDVCVRVAAPWGQSFPDSVLVPPHWQPLPVLALTPGSRMCL